jgi:hypothetical protein
MKSLFYAAFFIALFAPGLQCFAQAPFSTIDYVDINNINAAVLVHGDMWWNPALQIAQCEFPKGSGHDISFTGSLWMSGYDAGNNLHVSAQMYRQTGNDYWPGPLDANDSLTYLSSQGWAKIWKVNESDIVAFIGTATHTTTNTPTDILTWPAKGNPYAQGGFSTALTISQDMAPFVDVNNDGIYNPLQGDYPAIKGDQALWWVFSDNGPTHTQTNGIPLKVEIHAMAYAYSRGTLIDNVVYYEYTIFNRSPNNYTNYRIGQFADMDLGYAFDDYIGFDSSYRMGIDYNGNPFDGTGQVNSYDTMIPTAGVTMIVLPGDNPPATFVPAGSFIFFNNDYSALGNPVSPGEYSNYLRSMWRDSSHVVDDFQGYGIPSNGTGTGPNTNYVFPGDPSDTSKWSECSSQNPPGDRRFIITSNDFTLNAGASEKVVMALVTTNPMLHNGCPSTSFDSIKVVADTAWNIYFNPLPALSVSNLVNQNSQIRIYPNPAHDKIFIETNGMVSGQLVIYNTMGQAVNAMPNMHQSKTQVDIAGLPGGVYYILYRDATEQKAITFIKE